MRTADAQADLNLRWAHKSFCWFCHAVAKIIQNTKRYLAFSHRSEHS